MKLYSITNKTSAQHIGHYPGRDANEALDMYYSDAGYSCRVGAASELEVTVEQLLADLIVEEYNYADDVASLARMMVEMDRDSGECTVDVLDDPDAGSSDHWDATGVYDVAEELGLSRATVDAISWPAIRDAYAAAWREAVELDLAARDEVAAEDAADGVPLRIVAGRRVDLDGVPHLLVGTLGCEPEHGDGTREADLLVEAGILGERVALREERCWAYPILHDDRGLAVAACSEVASYLAARIEVAS